MSSLDHIPRYLSMGVDFNHIFHIFYLELIVGTEVF